MDFIDMMYKIYPYQTKEAEATRAEYVQQMFNLVANASPDKSEHLVSLSNPGFGIHWSECDDDPCSFNCYN